MATVALLVAACLAALPLAAKTLRFASGFDPQSLEAGLARLDAALLEKARTLLTEEERRRLDAEVEETLASTGARMTPAALEATRLSTAARLLRRRFGLPRLTLFD